MMVVDASAALELLLGTQRGTAWRGALSRRPERLCAPHLLDVEVLHVLRRYERAGEVSSARALAAIGARIQEQLHRGRFVGTGRVNQWTVAANPTQIRIGTSS